MASSSSSSSSSSSFSSSSSSSYYVLLRPLLFHHSLWNHRLPSSAWHTSGLQSIELHCGAKPELICNPACWSPVPGHTPLQSHLLVLTFASAKCCSKRAQAEPHPLRCCSLGFRQMLDRLQPNIAADLLVLDLQPYTYCSHTKKVAVSKQSLGSVKLFDAFCEFRNYCLCYHINAGRRECNWPIKQLSSHKHKLYVLDGAQYC